jgi:hypothetical protein
MRVLGTVTSATVSGFSGSVDSNGDDVGNGLFSWTYHTGSNVNAGNLDAGLVSPFTNGFDCGGLGPFFSGSCGSTFSVTFNGTGLSAGTVTQDGITMIAGATIDCSRCTNPVGASATAAPVPVPMVGAGLPGLVTVLWWSSRAGTPPT